MGTRTSLPLPEFDPDHNEVFSGFQALREAKTPAIGFDPRRKGPFRSHSEFANHCAPAPQKKKGEKDRCRYAKWTNNRKTERQKMTKKVFDVSSGKLGMERKELC
ncbi:hypothetical protein PoB_000457200 [Plakobranchus ocellatus]|uniref:Uncharacterized protein n=1 Tax=Plakobranchus ocellatus TaxID=259542 RepID=A0AAV3Y7I0_9GAST|nr:hypothetical protein PoB_000457200 [Plakobranchus ocellatus]